MPEDAAVELATIVVEAKIFAQPFQRVSPIQRTARFGEDPLRLRFFQSAVLAPLFGVGRTVLSKMRNLQTASVFAGVRRSDVFDGR
jgi:hypothetical protein